MPTYDRLPEPIGEDPEFDEIVARAVEVLKRDPEGRTYLLTRRGREKVRRMLWRTLTEGLEAAR